MKILPLRVRLTAKPRRLSGLRGMEAFVASEPPEADAPPYFGTTYLDAQGTRWQELNLHALSQHPAFLSISA